jgi:hypothetical protein
MQNKRNGSEKENNMLLSLIYIYIIIRNHIPKFIDFDFVELRFASVLRLPRPQGERRTETRLRVSPAQPKSIYFRQSGMG